MNRTYPKILRNRKRRIERRLDPGLEAQKHCRWLQGFELIPKVVTGVRFVDGEQQTQQAA